MELQQMRILWTWMSRLLSHDFKRKDWLKNPFISKQRWELRMLHKCCRILMILILISWMESTLSYHLWIWNLNRKKLSKNRWDNKDNKCNRWPNNKYSKIILGRSHHKKLKFTRKYLVNLIKTSLDLSQGKKCRKLWRKLNHLGKYVRKFGT